MHRLTAAAFVVLLLSGAAARAQSEPDLRGGIILVAKQKLMGTPDEQQACFKDATRYCSDEIPEGNMQVLACLKQHRSKLSKTCQKVLEDNGQ